MNQIFVMSQTAKDTFDENEAVRIFDDSENTSNDKILPGGNCYLCMDPMSEVLEWNTLEFSVRSPDESILNTPTSTTMWYLYNNQIIGRFHLDKVERENVGVYHITAYSVLESGTRITWPAFYIHSGSDQYKFSEFLLFAWTGFDQTYLDASLADSGCSCVIKGGAGWLNVLQQRLQQMGAVIYPGRDGRYKITKLGNEGRFSISTDRIFLGGTIDEPVTVSQVNVEYGWPKFYKNSSEVDSNYKLVFYRTISADETVVYTDGEEYNGVKIETEWPVYHYYYANCSTSWPTAGTIYLWRSGSNYARLYCSYAEPVFATYTLNNPDGASGQVLNVTGNSFMTSASRAQPVAQRLLDYYSKRRTVTMDIVVGDERPGDICEFTDPYGEHRAGILTSLDITISKTLRATATFAAGVVPAASLYDNYEIITASGTWTVPDGVTLIRAVLVGGGDGGNGGYSGNDGGESGEYEQNGYYYNHYIERGARGVGGVGGAGGNGGRVLTVELAAAAGDVYNIIIGKGGAGGTAGSKGAEGGDTTFGDFNSVDGTRYSAGYTGAVEGGKYGLPGSRGVKGGAAGYAYYYSSSSTGAGGTGGDSEVATGEAGTAANWSSYKLGDGGDGADGGSRATATGYGYGGDGGHGGGGGGGAGGLTLRGPQSTKYPVVKGTPGKGGKGGTGGKGGDGCVIIYY